MSTPDPDLAPIFVIGTGRSGTTLLRLMLNAHPRIHLTHEASFYVGTNLLPRRATGSDWLDTYLRSFSFAWLDLDPAAVRAEVPEPLAREDMRVAYRAIMRCKARVYGSERYGDKTPFHSGYVKAIYDDFPDARVIHIVRDPRATVASLVKMPWAAGSYMLNNWYCAMQLREVRPFRERMCEVRLEDLMTDPEREMRRLLDFVGEAWDPAVLDHVANAPHEDVPPFPWLLQATEPRGRSRSNWRTELPPEWVLQIERRNLRGMRDYGYERHPLDEEPGFFKRQRALRRDLPEALRFLARFVPLTRKMASRNPPTALEAQERLLQLNPGAWRHYPGFEIPRPPGY